MICNFSRLMHHWAMGQVGTSVYSIAKPSMVDTDGPAAQFVKETITQDNIVIFSKSRCPYCLMAKDVFTKLEKKFTAVELDSREDGDTIQNFLCELTGARTVPRVFIKGSFVGGGRDVKSMYDNGELEQMLIE